MAFRPRQAGQLSAINFEHLGSPDGDSALKNLLVSVSEMADGSSPLTNASLVDIFGTDNDPRGNHYTGNFDQQLSVDPNKTYYLVFSLVGNQQSLSLAGPITVSILTEHGQISQALPEPVDALRVGRWYQIAFTAARSGDLKEIVLDHVVDWEGSRGG